MKYPLAGWELNKPAILSKCKTVTENFTNNPCKTANPIIPDEQHRVKRNSNE